VKLFQLTYEVPGHTVKAPGVSEIEIRRETLFYAANSAEQVWQEAKASVLIDPEKEFIAIAQVSPAVTVLSARGDSDAAK
jgi:hypothetical protein